MTDAEDSYSSFQLLDGGTMFTARHFWLNGDPGTLMCGVGVWSWDDVSSVGTVPETVLEDMPEPKCLLYWRDSYVYLQAHFSEVQQAWRQYRKASVARKVFPFSSLFPFSGN